jgi:hypothetical protein
LPTDRNMTRTLSTLTLTQIGQRASRHRDPSAVQLFDWLEAP